MVIRIIEKKTFLEGLNITNQLTNDIVFMCETRTKSTYFTRSNNCKMDFKDLIIFELNFVKKSLHIELDLFFETIKGAECSIARQKILPIAFIKMADAITSWYYGDDDFKTFNGYRLSEYRATDSLSQPNINIKFINSKVFKNKFAEFIENLRTVCSIANCPLTLNLKHYFPVNVKATIQSITSA